MIAQLSDQLEQLSTPQPERAPLIVIVSSMPPACGVCRRRLVAGHDAVVVGTALAHVSCAPMIASIPTPAHGGA